MSYYTQRHGLRKPIEKTYIIDESKYAILFECCERYKINLAWKYSVECPDGRGVYACDETKLGNDLQYEIPSLYRNEYGAIVVPEKELREESKSYDQFALLDYIEFIRINCRDIKRSEWHSYYGHSDLSFASTNQIGDKFEEEINQLFEKTGLLYRFNEDHIIERVEEYGVLNETIVEQISTIPEDGVKKLLIDAVALHKTPNPLAQKDAVEKIWDALERLKTYYSADKKVSSNRLAEEMAGGSQPYIDLFEEEFLKLSKIGNSFRIRHHETDKTEITDLRHYDYFFNRCLSIIALSIQYLK